MSKLHRGGKLPKLIGISHIFHQKSRFLNVNIWFVFTDATSPYQRKFPILEYTEFKVFITLWSAADIAYGLDPYNFLKWNL